MESFGDKRLLAKTGGGARIVRHTFALARMAGGIILSGPKACRGSTNDAKILPVFLHSPVVVLAV